MKLLNKTPLKFSLFISLFLASLLSTQAMALGTGISTKYTKNCKPMGISQEEWDAYKKANRRPFRATPPLLFKRLNRAQEHLGEKRYTEALELLKTLESKNNKNPASLAQIHQMLSYVYGSMEKNEEALKYSIKAYEAKIFPYRVEQALLFRIASLQQYLEHNDETIKYMERWFEHAVKPKVRNYEYLGQAYAQANRLEDSVCPIYLALDGWFDENVKNIAKYKVDIAEYRQKLVDIQSGKIKLEEGEPQPTEPKEPAIHPKKIWYSALFRQHWQLKDLHGSVAVIKEALHHYPEDKQLWLNLSSAYVELNDDVSSTSVLALAEVLNLLEKSNEVRSLASGYAYLEVPYKAAETMEKGLNQNIIEAEVKQWNAVAVNWQYAQEINKSVKAYFKAAELDDNGKFYADAGSLLTSYENWSEAEKALQKALKKGLPKTKQQGAAYYNLGIARFNQNNFQGALAAMAQAGKIKSFKRRANQWKSIINQKMQRSKR